MKSGSSSGATMRVSRWARGRFGGRAGRVVPPGPPDWADAARMTSTTTATAITNITRKTIGHPPCRPPTYDRGDTRTRGCRTTGEQPAPDAGDGTEGVIDAVDEQLISLLRANGRASYAELARQVGLSAPSVHERVGKLEAAGVITGYRAVVDPAAVGLGVTALVGVIESDQVDDTGLEEALAALPSVEDCWRVAGSEGYVLKVRVPDIRHSRTPSARSTGSGRRSHPDDRVCPPSGRAVVADQTGAPEQAGEAGAPSGTAPHRRWRSGSCSTPSAGWPSPPP